MPEEQRLARPTRRVDEQASTALWRRTNATRRRFWRRRETSSRGCPRSGHSSRASQSSAIERSRRETCVARPNSRAETSGQRASSSTSRDTLESAARRVVGGTRRSQDELIGERESFLDAQAALPSSVEVRGQRKHSSRDYTALAGLAGYGPREYERLGAPGKRVARVEIDRELASRGQRSALERRESPAATGQTASEHRAGRIARRAGAAAGEPSTGTDPRAGEWPRSGSRDRPVMTRRSARPVTPARHEQVSASESSVMRDAREVAARRKRQLGPDRP